MKADQGPNVDLDAFLAQAKDQTEAIEPPPDFADRVLAATRARRRAWWGHVVPLGRRAVPCAALAAAAALALAWLAEPLPDASAVFDAAEETP
jgi:hypothetical protein